MRFLILKLLKIPSHIILIRIIMVKKLFNVNPFSAIGAYRKVHLKAIADLFARKRLFNQKSRIKRMELLIG